jgi:hypothetical protein
MKTRVFLFVFLVCLSGCYNLAVTNGPSGGRSIERRHNLFALGFYGEDPVDLTKECPGGTGNVSARFTVEDVLLTVASVGIYSPRTVTIECGSAQQG